MQTVTVDLLGLLPESQAGNTYILVADYFTRSVKAYLVPNQEATTVAVADEFFFRFSPPEQLHFDQGQEFESRSLQRSARCWA